MLLVGLAYDFISLRTDQHCMHTCFATSLRNTNGEVQLTLTCVTYAIDAGNLNSLYSSTFLLPTDTWLGLSKKTAYLKL